MCVVALVSLCVKSFLLFDVSMLCCPLFCIGCVCVCVWLVCVFRVICVMLLPVCVFHCLFAFLVDVCVFVCIVHRGLFLVFFVMPIC